MGTVWGVYLWYTVALHEPKIPILAMNTIVGISLAHLDLNTYLDFIL